MKARTYTIVISATNVTGVSCTWAICLIIPFNHVAIPARARMQGKNASKEAGIDHASLLQAKVVNLLKEQGIQKDISRIEIFNMLGLEENMVALFLKQFEKLGLLCGLG